MMDIKLQEKLCTLRTEDLKDVAMLVIEWRQTYLSKQDSQMTSVYNT